MSDAPPDSDQRRYPRYFLNLPAQLSGPAGQVAVWTSDISAGGARVDRDGTEGPPITGGGWMLEVLPLGSFPVRLVWQRGTSHGLEFVLPAAARATLDARLARMLPGAAPSRPPGPARVKPTAG